jgi:hypothetical protein
MAAVHAFINADPRPELAQRITDMCVALDGHRVASGDAPWTLQVHGIHDDGRDLWIQVARQESPEESLVLRLSPWANARHALVALDAVDPFEDTTYPRVVRVMHAA